MAIPKQKKKKGNAPRFFVQTKAYVIPFNSKAGAEKALTACKNKGVEARLADNKGRAAKVPNPKLTVITPEMFKNKLKAYTMPQKANSAKSSRTCIGGRTMPTGTSTLKPNGHGRKS